MSLGQSKAAVADAQAVVTLNPASAMGYLALGQANEGLGNYPEAIAAYQKASTLAQAQNKPEIDVLARMQLATLMQEPSVPTSSVP